MIAPGLNPRHLLVDDVTVTSTMLTLRRQFRAKDDRFWSVHSDGVAVGAIIQPVGLTDWNWSITVQVNSAIARNGKAGSRGDAMAEFRETWKRFRAELGDEGWAQHVAHMAELAERAKQW